MHIEIKYVNAHTESTGENKNTETWENEAVILIDYYR